MKKEYLLLTAFVLAVFAVTAYYFTPKTMVACGSALPVTCLEYKCEKGFIYNPTPIGAATAKCLFGGAATPIDAPVLATSIQTQVASSETNPELIEKKKCETTSKMECVLNFVNEGCGWVPSEVGAGKFIYPAGGEVFVSGQNKDVTWEMVNPDYFRFDYEAVLLDKENTQLGVVARGWLKDQHPFKIVWDFKTFYDNYSNPIPGSNIPDGEYKLRFIYHHQCNFDVSMFFDSDFFRIENSIDESKLRNLDADYLTDGIHIYERMWLNHFEHRVVLAEKYDASSFQVLGMCWESGNATHMFYVKDKSGVYCGDEVMPGADTGTFTPLNASVGNNIADDGIAFLAKDKNGVFGASTFLKGIDGTTFKRYGGNYIGDKDKVYYYNTDLVQLTLVVGADVGTFNGVPFSRLIPSGYAKDKDRYYKDGIAEVGDIPKEILGAFSGS